MSKAALAIEASIEKKQKELDQHIRDNKEVMTKFGILKNELADLKQYRYTIALNRINNFIEEHPAYKKENQEQSPG